METEKIEYGVAYQVGKTWYVHMDKRDFTDLIDSMIQSDKNGIQKAYGDIKSSVKGFNKFFRYEPKEFLDVYSMTPGIVDSLSKDIMCFGTHVGEFSKYIMALKSNESAKAISERGYVENDVIIKANDLIYFLRDGVLNLSNAETLKELYKQDLAGIVEENENEEAHSGLNEYI